MNRYRKIAKKVSAKAINADASVTVSNLIYKLQSHFKELERIKDSLVNGFREIERQGLGREMKSEFAYVIKEIKDAQSGLLNMATSAKGMATDIETGFLY
jgi:hypothetical protein